MRLKSFVGATKVYFPEAPCRLLELNSHYPPAVRKGPYVHHPALLIELSIQILKQNRLPFLDERVEQNQCAISVEFEPRGSRCQPSVSTGTRLGSSPSCISQISTYISPSGKKTGPNPSPGGKSDVAIPSAVGNPGYSDHLSR